MIALVLAPIISLLRDLLAIHRRSEHEQVLAILRLRPQLRMLPRPHPRPPPAAREAKWRWLCALLNSPA